MILILGASLLCAWDGFTYVAANEFNSGIRVDWQAKDEQNVHYYEIYRSRSDSDILDKGHQYQHLAKVPPILFKTIIFSRNHLKPEITALIILYVP